MEAPGDLKRAASRAVAGASVFRGDVAAAGEGRAGSKEPLVVLPAELQQPFSVHLFEARPGDPKVPQGKAFAVLQLHDMGYIEDGERSNNPNVICEDYESRHVLSRLAQGGGGCLAMIAAARPERLR